MTEARSTAVDQEAMEVAKASYDRCCQVAGFFDAFYENFFRNCPEAAPMFAKTDFGRQHRLLRHAIGLLLIFPAQPEGETALLHRIAMRHSRKDLNVEPTLYGPFVDSLMDTVREHDPEFTPSVETAWRTTVAKGVAYMQSKY